MGKTEANVILRTGLTPIRVVFKNGRGERKVSRPACYATSDPAMQAIIESSHLFKNKTIILKSQRAYNCHDSKPVSVENSDAEPKQEAERDDSNVYKEVVSRADALELLKSKGVSVMPIRGNEYLRSLLIEHDLICPNLNLE